MNVSLASITALPDALSRPGLNGNGRRHLIGHHDLDPGVLRHFNDLLEQIDIDRQPLERDQIASAARELVDNNPSDSLAPSCIRQRMRRAGAIDLMLTDPEWETLALASIAAAIVVDYMRASSRRGNRVVGTVDLIPNSLPLIGRLDDAVLIETAWPKVGEEVRNYLDFCRLRRIEAGLRGERRPHFGFTREQWLAASQAEAEWIAHCQRVGRNSYVSIDGGSRFRIN